MSVARRFLFVSSRLALITHHVAALRYDGDCASKNAQALAFARNSASSSRPSATLPCSNEYLRVRFSLRRSNARSPAGCMRPEAISSCARRRLTVLQMLFGLRGVKRMR